MSDLRWSIYDGLINRYFIPFIGAGALQPKRFFYQLNPINPLTKNLVSGFSRLSG
jgi:hypothetical protein